MKRKWMMGVLLLAGMLLAPASEIYAANSAARVELGDAVQEATKWQPDAILTSVSSLTVDTEGNAATWFYGFYSPKAGKWLNVTAKGRSIETLELGTGQTEAVPTDFLDSDKAMQAAAKLGVKGDAPRMGLSRAAWLISGGDKKGSVAVWLNPRTGRLIKRQTVQ